ncbi:hypothetical protein B0O80DRAFT_502273 [Mortierella sp. GBAus27b]|nr:hypothetical protein B0O80DRAFT_502273 [Mortierella sp. GBAus27b]
MDSTHPSDLPEIIQHVARYTPKSCFPSCARVSRAWYRVFVPLVWESVEVKYSNHCLPKATRNHRHLIKRLKFIHEPISNPALVCPNLVSLTVANGLQARCLTMLVTEHPSITFLEMYAFEPSLGIELWNKLHECNHHLKGLKLTSMFIDTKDTDAFWQLCTRLERVYFTNLRLLSRGSLSSMEFPHIKEVSLWNFSVDGNPLSVEFMRRCPGITACHFAELFGFALPLDANVRPLLHNLSLQNDAIEETTFREIIEGMPRINALSVYCAPSSIKSPSMTLLRQHFGNLTDLSLRCSDEGVMFPMAQEIMSSCPLLKHLRATRINAVDIAQGKPWVCLGLKLLDLSIQFDPSSNHIVQPLVFDQLSRLRQLQVMCFWNHKEDDLSVPVFQQAIDLRLQNGLDKLSTLRALQTIDLGTSKQKMGRQEIIWMSEHWRCLERVHGILNQSDSEDWLLKRSLLSRGVTAI